ncbi:putative PEP-CTERM system TPR-repeat lipoprotein [Legionella massiliensis]|uniref:Putative PEP-CTERM system TPR-repeat lipoprotein n=1 Tax=Legionella massiliensis TaxID=1034943 RepID=A0A078KSC8_9GAMM|nr:hypothetical protein [Legionella massiliensis]CDZ75872.1 putative PEP-CTERM system TPR-repeat lipoprotein [Legionella massiliensis]CEE11610.1 Tetratricopeptide repeat protein [Legionella massiliensis]
MKRRLNEAPKTNKRVQKTFITAKNSNDDRALTMQSVEELNSGNLEAAINKLNTAILINPHNGHAYSIRGEVKLKQGNLNSSLVDLNKAIDLIPNNSFAYKIRCKVKYHLGD